MCGTPLTAPPVPSTPVLGGPQPPAPHPYYAYTAAYWETQRAGKIDNTKTGLLLLIIGLMSGWIPFVSTIGEIIALIGAVLVIQGREAFGPEHVRYVVVSIIIFFVGIGVTVAGVITLFLASLTFSANNPSSVFQPYSSSFITIIIIGGAITGVSGVLFTYALQKEIGRILLWSGLATSIVITIVNILFVFPLFTGGGIVFFQTSIFFLGGFLGAIPAALYAIPFYLARDRVIRREIPQGIASTPGNV